MGRNGNDGISSISRQYICRATLQGSYESGRKIPLPTSQMPLDFKRKALDGFWAKRLTLLMSIKRTIMLAQCFLVWIACSFIFIIFILWSRKSRLGEMQWYAQSPTAPKWWGLGLKHRTFDSKSQLWTHSEALRKEMKLENNREETLRLAWRGWVNVVPLESNLPMLHYPETAMSGKGKDPKRK